MVASVAEKRVFINALDNAEFHYDECYPDFDGMQFLYATPRAYWPVYITEVNGQRGIISERCADCRAKGGVTAKPYFWID